MPHCNMQCCICERKGLAALSIRVGEVFDAKSNLRRLAVHMRRGEGAWDPTNDAFFGHFIPERRRGFSQAVGTPSKSARIYAQNRGDHHFAVFESGAGLVVAAVREGRVHRRDLGHECAGLRD